MELICFQVLSQNSEAQSHETISLISSFSFLNEWKGSHVKLKEAMKAYLTLLIGNGPFLIQIHVLFSICVPIFEFVVGRKTPKKDIENENQQKTSKSFNQ